MGEELDKFNATVSPTWSHGVCVCVCVREGKGVGLLEPGIFSCEHMQTISRGLMFLLVLTQ